MRQPTGYLPLSFRDAEGRSIKTSDTKKPGPSPILAFLYAAWRITRPLLAVKLEDAASLAGKYIEEQLDVQRNDQQGDKPCQCRHATTDGEAAH